MELFDSAGTDGTSDNHFLLNAHRGEPRNFWKIEMQKYQWIAELKGLVALVGHRVEQSL